MSRSQILDSPYGGRVERSSVNIVATRPYRLHDDANRSGTPAVLAAAASLTEAHD
jgi:hypothetical protein